MSATEYWPPSDVEPGDVIETVHIASHFGSEPFSIHNFYEVMTVDEDGVTVRFDHLLIKPVRR